MSDRHTEPSEPADELIDLLDWQLAAVRRLTGDWAAFGRLRAWLGEAAAVFATEAAETLADLREWPGPLGPAQAARAWSLQAECYRMAGGPEAAAAGADRPRPPAPARGVVVRLPLPVTTGLGRRADETDRAAAGVLGLVEWLLDGLRRHADRLARRTDGLSPGATAVLTDETATACRRLDRAAFAVTLLGGRLSDDLRGRPVPLTPVDDARLGTLFTELGRVAEGWSNRADGLRPLWAADPPPD